MRVSDRMMDAAMAHTGNAVSSIVMRKALEDALLADPITIKARMGLEAQMGHNDTWPGEDYAYRFTTLSEAWDNLQDAIRRVDNATPSKIGGAVESLETARLIMGAALARESK